MLVTSEHQHPAAVQQTRRVAMDVEVLAKAIVVAAKQLAAASAPATQPTAQPTQQEEQEKKLQFSQFEKFDSGLKIQVAEVENGTVVSFRKGKQMCAFLLTSEVASGLVRLVREYGPPSSSSGKASSSSGKRKGRGA
jgi:hypothetical protein